MTKRRIVMIVVLTMLAYFILFISLKWLMHTPSYYFSSGYLDGPQLAKAIYLLDLEDVYVTELYNDAGGFHGDGIELYSVDYDEKKINISTWSEIPDEEYENHIRFCLSEDNKDLNDYIMNISTGKYYLADMNPNDNYSENYVLGIYDDRHEKIYILIVNT